MGKNNNNNQQYPQQPPLNQGGFPNQQPMPPQGNQQQYPQQPMPPQGMQQQYPQQPMPPQGMQQQYPQQFHSQYAMPYVQMGFPPGMSQKEMKKYINRQQKAQQGKKEHSFFYYLTMPIWILPYVFVWLPISAIAKMLKSTITWTINKIAIITGKSVKVVSKTAIKILVWPLKIFLMTLFMIVIVMAIFT